MKSADYLKLSKLGKTSLPFSNDFDISAKRLKIIIIHRRQEPIFVVVTTAMPFLEMD